MNETTGEYELSSAAGLSYFDGKSEAKINLMNDIEATLVMKSNLTIDGKNKKVNAVNLNGADNVVLKNITFDAANAIQGYNGNGKAIQFANIITGGADKPGSGSENLVIEGCTFTGTFADGGVTIGFTDQNRSSGQSGNITIKGCTFSTKGAYCHIYTYYSGKGTFNIENNTFETASIDKPIYLGRYQSSTPVVVKGNDFKKVSSFADAALIQAHSTAYTVSFNESENTFAE